MRNSISRLNKVRKFWRQHRRANAEAKRTYRSLSEEQRSLINQTLTRFRPVDTGHQLIRIGPDHDGGYLLPDDLEGLVALYSPGVSDTTGFDWKMAEIGLECYLADGTVDAPEKIHPRMNFEKIMIGIEVSEGFTTLENWVTHTAAEPSDLILQMDIEGAEYDVLLHSESELLKRFRIIVVELHFIDQMLLSEERSKLDDLLQHLEKTHAICHTHANNVAAPVSIGKAKVPPFVEITLLRRDRLKSSGGEEAEFPNSLDAVNLPELPSIQQTAFWRSE